MIDFSFTPEQEQLRRQIIALAQQTLNDEVVERDREQRFDRDKWEAAGQLKLQGLAIPEAYGGHGLDIISTMHALEALGYGCRDNGLSFAIGAHLLACVVPLWLYGSEDQKQRLLPALCNGQYIAANAITEATSGSDVYNMSSLGKPVEGGYQLSGEKHYCSNASVADYFLAYVLTNPAKGAIGGISAFLLEKAEVEVLPPVDKMGMRSVMMSALRFEDLHKGPDNMLGQEGAGMMIFNQSMIWERIGLSILHLGTLQRLLEECIAFVKKRKAFGQAIAQFQSINHQMADIATAINAARWSTYHAAWCLQQDKMADRQAAMVKLMVSELYKKTCGELLQIYGTAGYINNSEIERNLRDAVASTLYSGTSRVQRNKIARWLKIG
ncbi:MAG: acyl-CoA dehydrogenase family protein [Bacteroidota bacterium]